MLCDILTEVRAPMHLLMTFSDRCKYLLNYLSRFLQRQELGRKEYYNYFPKMLFILIIILHFFLNISAAFSEVCGFESSQSCRLYDCAGNSWYIDNSIGYPKSPSLRSGDIQNGGESSLCRNVTGPAIINFWWRAEGINSCLGSLFFLVDGQKKYSCTSTKWQNSSYTIRDKRDHTISWIYKKIKSYPEYSGGGWIDNLSIESQNNWLPQGVMGEANASVQSLESIENPISLTINPALLTINATNVFMNSSIIRLNTTKMLTDSFSIATNVSKLEINSSNMSTNIYGNIKIPKISKVNVDKILDTNSNISPPIELLWPKNNTEYKINDSACFKYALHPSDNSFINKCSLCLNEKEIIMNSNENYDDEIVYSFNHTLNRNLLGTNKWRIRCYDNFSKMYESSEYRSINVYLNSSKINVTNETDINNCNFSSINKAIYYAPPQSTIAVYKKINDAHIIINKSINLVSMNNSTIYNEGKDPEIILINGSNVSIKGFSLKATRNQLTVNILNNSLCNINIDKNDISDGFKVNGVKNITIIDNVIAKNTIRNAIHLERCSEITLNNNVITGLANDRSGVGVFLDNCNLTEKIKFVKNNISKVIVGVEICTPNYKDVLYIKEYIKSNNNITNFNFMQEYDVRFTCD